MVHGQSAVRAYGFNSQKFGELKNILKRGLNYDLIGGAQVNLALGSKSKAVGIADKISSLSNALVLSDMVSQSKAVDASIARALYDTYDML